MKGQNKDTVLTAFTLLNWDKNKIWTMIELIPVNLEIPWFNDIGNPHQSVPYYRWIVAYAVWIVPGRRPFPNPSTNKSIMSHQ